MPNTDCSCSKVRQPSSKLRLSTKQHQATVEFHARDASAVIVMSLLRHGEASLNVKLSTSNGHSLLTAEPRCNQVLTLLSIMIQASMH